MADDDIDIDDDTLAFYLNLRWIGRRSQVLGRTLPLSACGCRFEISFVDLEFGGLKLVVCVDGHWVARARSLLTPRSSRPARSRAGDAARASFHNIRFRGMSSRGQNKIPLYITVEGARGTCV
jgi:hypothetical protein